MNEEQIKKIAIDIGGKEWEVLPEVLSDSSFTNLLNNQERSVVNQIRQNPPNIQGYFDYIADIIAKYYTWKLYKDTNLKKLKEEVNSLSKQIKSSESDFSDLERNAKLANGAVALAAYSETFSKRSESHKINADVMKKSYGCSLLILFLIVGLTFFFNFSDINFIKSYLADDMREHFSLALLALKAVLIFFFFQIIQFFRKNYNAEKHLQEVYQHRSDTLQSLHAVYSTIENKEEKDKLLATAALFAYERGETGYITTKEGAGSTDFTETILGKFIK